jgi:hypothetical protein
MTFFGATAILEFVHIYLKAGYASCMSNPIYFTFDSVWAAPTKKSELPLTDVDERPNKDPKIIQTLYTQKKTQDTYPDLTFEEAKELTASMTKAI